MKKGLKPYAFAATALLLTGLVGGMAHATAVSVTISDVTLTPEHSGDAILTGTYKCTNGEPQLGARAIQGPAEASSFFWDGDTCTGTAQSYSILLANTTDVRLHPGLATIQVILQDADSTPITLEQKVIIKHH